MMDIANILQTLTIAVLIWIGNRIVTVTKNDALSPLRRVLIWIGNRIVTVSEKTAVHEEKLNAQHERINKLEEKPACPHINRV